MVTFTGDLAKFGSARTMEFTILNTSLNAARGVGPSIEELELDSKSDLAYNFKHVERFLGSAVFW